MRKNADYNLRIIFSSKSFKPNFFQCYWLELMKPHEESINHNCIYWTQPVSIKSDYYHYTGQFSNKRRKQSIQGKLWNGREFNSTQEFICMDLSTVTQYHALVCTDKGRK